MVLAETIQHTVAHWLYRLDETERFTSRDSMPLTLISMLFSSTTKEYCFASCPPVHQPLNEVGVNHARETQA